MFLGKFFAVMVLPSFHRILLGVPEGRRFVIRSCLAVVLGGALFALHASAGFITAPTYPAGRDPGSLAIGDFNGDGNPDVAVLQQSGISGPGRVSVLLGKGDGSFQAQQSYGVGLNPWSVVVGDFNGDGHLDLAVGAQDSSLAGMVTIFLGAGDGTFQAGQSFIVGPAGASLAVADFNQDGILDLAVASSSSSTLSVFLGNGDGTFQSAQSYAVGRQPLAVAVGDFNEDGKLDLAVVSFSGTVSILLGNGDGTFRPAQNYAVGDVAWSVVVGDLNGDGHLDVAVVNPFLHNGTVSVLQGNGDGSFQAVQKYTVGSSPRSLAVGDFNGDGIADLAVVNQDSGTVSILLGRGDGTLGEAQTYAASSGTFSVADFLIAAGDFNRDGKLDLVVATDYSPGAGAVSVLLGKGDGTFQAAPTYAVGSYPRSVAVGDFNGDGILDLAVGGVPVSILLGNGDGSFQPARTYNVVGTVAVGDFNGDGILDLAVAESGAIAILLGNGDGLSRLPCFRLQAAGLFPWRSVISTATANSTSSRQILIIM